MATTFRWLMRIFTGLIVIALVGLMLVYWFASRSLPDYSATHQVQGITGEVEIVRNNANVPHIFGEIMISLSEKRKTEFFLVFPRKAANSYSSFRKSRKLR